MRTLEKVILISGVIALIFFIVLILKPWLLPQEYTFEYLRNKANEIAEVIESLSSIRLTEDWFIEKVSLKVEVIKPNEEPLIIQVSYSKLKINVPKYTNQVVIIRGSPHSKKFEYFRRVSVYHNASWIIIDPKPIVKYYIVREYDRKVHVVEITLFNIVGELKKGCILKYANSSKLTLTRCYDYNGEVKILIDRQLALNFNVTSKDVLKLVIVREIWISKY